MTQALKEYPTETKPLPSIAVIGGGPAGLMAAEMLVPGGVEGDLYDGMPSSGRVFPKDMKAAPLLRAWLHRLRESGVRFHARHRWLGWDESGALRFSTLAGEQVVQTDAGVLALGGGSWGSEEH